MSSGDAIHLIDLEYLGEPGMIGAYLVVGRNSRPVLIETGPASTYERLKAGIADIGYSIADIQDVLVTHIHLDHAGAAGLIAQEPGFTGRIHVHAFGAQHLIDPTKLIDSAKRIYGDQMDRLWGHMVAVPEHKVVALHDGEVIDTAGLHFTAIETPGHARHHCCYAMPHPSGRGRPVCFAGDVAGMVVPLVNRVSAGDSSAPNAHCRLPTAKHYPFINLPTPPPEFDAGQWFVSIARLEHARFGSLFLTHIGEVRTPDSHLLNVRRAIRAHTEFVRVALQRGLEESVIVDRYRTWVLRQTEQVGISPEQAAKFVSNNLIQMNVTGIIRSIRR